MLKCLVCSHVDNIKESSNNEGKKGKKISLYYRLKCNKLRGVLRSLMETAPIYICSEMTFLMYLHSMYPFLTDTCFLYICSRPFCRIHALGILF